MTLFPIPESGEPQVGGITLPDPAPLILDATRAMYRTSGFVEPWIGYLAVEDNHCVGTCGFKSPPLEGRTEIAYFTFPGHEGKGIGGRMATALVKRARAADPAVILIAQTLPVENPSSKILKRLGFSWVREWNHPQDGKVWEWRFPPL